MSRLGKQPIKIPAGVDIKIEESLVTVKGPKGQLQQKMPNGVDIIQEDGSVIVKPQHDSRELLKFWGLARVLVDNMIKGVTEGCEKILEFNGIGFKAAVKDGGMEMSLGFSHPIIIPAQEGIEFKVEKSKITISGIDKELIGQVAARVRAKRPPEPYKGTGIFYKGETITRKAGKKAATG